MFCLKVVLEGEFNLFFFLKPCKLEEVINICIHKCPEIPIQRKKERQNKILNSVVDQKK